MKTGETAAADGEVDRLYRPLRRLYRDQDPKANGYVCGAYFRREQATLFSLIRPGAGLLVDVGCGSGLMVRPLLTAGHDVVGIDFNDDACAAAAAAGLPVIRGDAYRLPLRPGAAATIVNTQFLNQQRTGQAARLLTEIAGALRPGGVAVLVWRNGRALVHRASLPVLRALGRIRGRPEFPLVDHDLAAIVRDAGRAGLVLRESFLSFPPLGLRFRRATAPGARLLGASCYAVFEKPAAPDGARAP